MSYFAKFRTYPLIDKFRLLLTALYFIVAAAVVTFDLLFVLALSEWVDDWGSLLVLATVLLLVAAALAAVAVGLARNRAWTQSWGIVLTMAVLIFLFVWFSPAVYVLGPLTIVTLIYALVARRANLLAAESGSRSEDMFDRHQVYPPNL